MRGLKVKTKHMAKRNQIQDLAYETIRFGHPTIEGLKILDVGAGTGYLTMKLIQIGARVTAMDLCEFDPPITGLESFVVHDLNNPYLPLEDGTFDVVVSTEVIEHLRAPFIVLTEMIRTLKSGGLLVFTTPNYWNLKYRVKYLLSGNLQRPIINDKLKKMGYLKGSAPHIVMMTYPTVKAILTWEGCKNIELQAKSLYNLFGRIQWLPFYMLVRLYSLFSSARRRKKYLLDETNSPMVLLGRQHILVRCQKG